MSNPRFQVWDPESKTMRKVLQINWKEEEDEVDCAVFRSPSGELRYLCHNITPFDLCQNTELKDDDGEELCVWDIVELHIPHETKAPYYSLIYQTAKGYMVEPPPGHRGFDPTLRDLHYYTTDVGKCKKVGNFHTHIELVKDVLDEKIAQMERNNR